ncbi:UNVERIFIED_CONTAM: hypothetical protein PYX00_011554 [Menopon gallinae]|uniref:Uncharacterized protein n=1 Tax=Menopon gallinae TaxID=328185 RepID=A0AAW2H849_9NEOP
MRHVTVFVAFQRSLYKSTTADAMHCARALMLLLHITQGEVLEKCVCVRFRDKDGAITETKRYSADSTIFRMSRHLRTELRNQRRYGILRCSETSQLHLDVACEPAAFDMATALCDNGRSDSASTEDVFSVLHLAEQLDIDKESCAAFYMSLAEASPDAEGVLKNAWTFCGTHGARIYALQLLRRYMSARGLDIMVRETQATLCPVGPEHVYGSASEVGAVSRVRVLKHAMGAVSPQEMDMLWWFASAVGVRELDVSGCELCADTMASVQRIQSLEWIDASFCRMERGALAHLQGLACLRELRLQWSMLDAGFAADLGAIQGLERLDISCSKVEPGSLGFLGTLRRLKELSVMSTVLGDKDVLCIARMQSLEVLNMGSCKMALGSLRYLQMLGCLKKLVLSHSSLCGSDTAELAKIARLAVLDISHCRFEHRCLARLAVLRLEELDVSCSVLSSSNLAGIGGIRSLVKLNMQGCTVAPRGLVYLKGLQGLRSLCVSCVELHGSNLAAIWKIQSLEVLNISCCKIGPGGLRHLRKLCKLRELYVSHNYLGEDDVEEIRQARLEKWEANGCRVEPRRFRCIRELVAGTASSLIGAPSAPHADLLWIDATEARAGAPFARHSQCILLLVLLVVVFTRHAAAGCVCLLAKAILGVRVHRPDDYSASEILQTALHRNTASSARHYVWDMSVKLALNIRMGSCLIPMSHTWCLVLLAAFLCRAVCTALGGEVTVEFIDSRGRDVDSEGYSLSHRMFGASEYMKKVAQWMARGE